MSGEPVGAKVLVIATGPYMGQRGEIVSHVNGEWQGAMVRLDNNQTVAFPWSYIKELVYEVQR